MNENEVDENKLRERLESVPKKELISRLVRQMALNNAAQPILEDAKAFRTSYWTIPFIPEDMGFKEHMQSSPDGVMPPVRMYFRDTIVCTKSLSGDWIISVGDDHKMAIDIPSKFHAFIIFTCLGVKFKDSDSTVPDMDTQIAEIIKDAKEEE